MMKNSSAAIDQTNSSSCRSGDLFVVSFFPTTPSGSKYCCLLSCKPSLMLNMLEMPGSGCFHTSMLLHMDWLLQELLINNLMA